MNPTMMKTSVKQEHGKQEQFTEFKLRVPKNLVKKYNVIKINAPRPIKFENIKEASMVRKTKKQAYVEEESSSIPTHGAGSVYNFERKEEARKKKRGYVTKEIFKEDLPYALRLGGKSGKRYTGKKEPMEHSAYYILTQSPDGVFEAVPVQAWYNFTPDIDYATLNDEEVEHEFSRRDRTLNHFATKYKLGLQTDDETAKVNQKYQDHNLIIHDDDENDDGGDIEAGLEETSDDDKKKKSGGSGNKKNLYRGKKKKKKGEDDDEVNIMDSDEEEDEEKVESKEVDYMSESSSEDEVNQLDDEPDPEKDIHAKAKDDLNVFSDTEDEESDTEKNLNDVGKELKAILKKETVAGESSDEEDEDIDSEYSKSVVLLQGKDKSKKKGRSGSNSGSRKGSRSATPVQVIDLESDTINQVANSLKEGKAGSKRSHENASPTTSSKKQKLGSINVGNKRSESPLANQQRSSTPSDGTTISEEAIRKYLSHKPLTVTDLMRKFIKKTGLKKEQVKNALAPLLTRIQPNQEKIDGKLYLSIKSKK